MTEGEKQLGVIGIVEDLLKEYVLCDNCLGRQFAILGHGLTNEERGRALKLVCILEGHKLVTDENANEVLVSIAMNGLSEVAIQTIDTLGIKAERREVTCYLCQGVFKNINEIAQYTAKELSGYEYNSFLVGIKTNAAIEDREDELRSKFGIRWGESIRNELSREIGKRIMEETQKSVNLKRPDILVIINPFTKQVTLEVNSIFIAGRYRKLVRNISQSRWVCNECRGQGCQKCGGTGKLYADSVEELITTPLVEMTKGQSDKLHAAGREDIDVRTLGSGRPFIAEVKKPRLRKIDLKELRRCINLKANGKIEVSALRLSSKEGVRSLKQEEKVAKVYRAVVEFSREVTEDDIAKIEGLSNTVINQLTPLRVAHRRAMKIRKKYLYRVDLKKMEPNVVEMVIQGQGGLYIKELINGDEGRTSPSVSGVVNTPTKCVELDVMEIQTEVWKQDEF